MTERIINFNKRLAIATASAGALVASIVHPVLADGRVEHLNPNQTVTKCNPGEFAFIEADATVISNGETRATWDGKGGYASALAKGSVTVNPLGEGNVACGTLAEVSAIGEEWKGINARGGRRVLNTVRVGFGEVAVSLVVQTPVNPQQPEVMGGVVYASPTPRLVPEGCYVYGDVSDYVAGRKLHDEGVGSENTASVVRTNRRALITFDFDSFVECIRDYGIRVFTVEPLKKGFDRWILDTVKGRRIPLESIDLNKGDGGEVPGIPLPESIFR